jgi:hypothetical protein
MKPETTRQNNAEPLSLFVTWGKSPLPKSTSHLAFSVSSLPRAFSAFSPKICSDSLRSPSPAFSSALASMRHCPPRRLGLRSLCCSDPRYGIHSRGRRGGARCPRWPSRPHHHFLHLPRGPQKCPFEGRRGLSRSEFMFSPGGSGRRAPDVSEAVEAQPQPLLHRRTGNPRQAR